MSLANMVDGLRRASAKKTKFYGIQLTQAEVDPVVAEYDALLAENQRLRGIIKKCMPGPVSVDIGGGEIICLYQVGVEC